VKLCAGAAGNNDDKVTEKMMEFNLQATPSKSKFVSI